MKWNKHSDLEGSHAFLGASRYSWLNYDEDKLLESYISYMAKERGTELHDLAKRLIKNRVKLPRTRQTLNMYVNDAIGFKMDPEVPLKYSNFCYGTADAIYFSDKTKILRIHDLKTGKTKASFHQLEIYASLFCLEYEYKPNDLKEIELRLYQNDEVLIGKPGPDIILPIMDKIQRFDKKLKEFENKY